MTNCPFILTAGPANKPLRSFSHSYSRNTAKHIHHLGQCQLEIVHDELVLNESYFSCLYPFRQFIFDGEKSINSINRSCFSATRGFYILCNFFMR